jgi:hypothetical protein
VNSQHDLYSSGNPLHRRIPNWVILLIVALVHLAISLSALNPTPHNGGDNAGYLSLANSLATNANYIEIWDPADPLHTKYPPLYPVLLAVAILLGAKTWMIFKILSVFCVTTAVVLSFVWTKDRNGLGLALGVAVVLMFSPAFLWSSNWILSDPLFLVLTLGCLWAFHNSEKREQPVIWTVVGCLMAILAAFTRTAGLPLVIAVGGVLLLNRRWKTLGRFSLAFAIPSLAWWLRSRRAGQAQYMSEFWLVDPYQPDLGTAGFLDLVTRVLDNFHSYVFSYIPRGLTTWSDIFLMVLGLLIVFMAGIGYIRRFRKRITVAELFIPLYFGLILLWPTVWSGDRFILPLYPLILFYAGEVLLIETARLHARGPLVSGVVAVLLLTVPSSQNWINTVHQASACRKVVKAAGPFACYNENFQQFVVAARWLGENAPDGTSVFSRKPRFFYTISGIKSRTYPLSSNPKRFFEEAKDADIAYVVLDRIDRLGAAYIAPVIMSHPEAFCSLVRVGSGESPTQIFGINSQTLASTKAEWNKVSDLAVGIEPCPAKMLRSEPKRFPSPTTLRVHILGHSFP